MPLDSIQMIIYIVVVFILFIALVAILASWPDKIIKIRNAKHKTYNDRLLDKVDKYSSKFNKLVYKFIIEDENILYEDNEIVCIENPYKDGMLEINKSDIKKYAIESFDFSSNESACIQNILLEIHWQVMYWSIDYTENEADEFLIEHGKKPYRW